MLYSMKTPIVVSALLCAFLSACSTVRVEHEFDPSVDLARYRTFALLPNPHPEHDKVAVRVLGLENTALLVAASVLEAKGFSRDDGGNADFYLGARVGKRQPVASRAMEYGGGNALVMTAWDGAKLTDGMGEPIAVYNPPSTQQDNIDNSSHRSDSDQWIAYYLIVDVFDSKTRKLVWQGWARGGSLGAFSSDSKRADSIDKILRHFPN